MSFFIRFIVLFTALTSAFVPLYRNTNKNKNAIKNRMVTLPTNHNEKEREQFIEKTEELKNACCGEVNEKQDIENLEKLERECFEMYQKITKYNKKYVYKKSPKFYKFTTLDF